MGRVLYALIQALNATRCSSEQRFFGTNMHQKYIVLTYIKSLKYDFVDIPKHCTTILHIFSA